MESLSSKLKLRIFNYLNLDDLLKFRLMNHEFNSLINWNLNTNQLSIENNCRSMNIDTMRQIN